MKSQRKMTIRSNSIFARRSILLAAALACLMAPTAGVAAAAPSAAATTASADATRLLTPRPQDAPNGSYGAYLTYPEIQAKISGWLHSHPSLVQVRSLGKTVEGRDIPLVRLSAAPANAGVPEVLLLAGIHPREQQPPIAMAHLVDELLAGYNRDPALTRLLKERVIWVVPMFNVDGKVYDMQHGNGTTRGADWRKNRDRNPDGTVGVDLNRNFGVRWGGNHAVDARWHTTTTSASENIYEGRSPFSEPEDRALAQFIRSRQGHLRAFLDLHSPLHALYEPAYLSSTEYARYKGLLDGMRAAQQDPYPTSTLHPDEDTPPGERRGDTGLTYTWVYYTQGVYALNLEFAPPPAAPTGPDARYAPPAQIETEYTNNIRKPLLYLLQKAGDLPAAHAGSATLTAGAAGTCDTPPAPGATVSWTPPAIHGAWDYAVLVSEGGEVEVLSEFRHAPLAQGFTVRVDRSAKPGARVPMTLYLWDRNHGVTASHFPLTIASPETAARS